VSFCRHNPLCCFSTSVYCCKHVFLYRIRSKTFGYPLVFTKNSQVYGNAFRTLSQRPEELFTPVIGPSEKHHRSSVSLHHCAEVKWHPRTVTHGARGAGRGVGGWEACSVLCDTAVRSHVYWIISIHWSIDGHKLTHNNSDPFSNSSA
jgi:hypothetical protein